MTYKFELFSKETALLGIRVHHYNFCDSKDENGKLIIKGQYDISIGLLFIVFTLTVRTNNRINVE